jgi:hypothetical protein
MDKIYAVTYLLACLLFACHCSEATKHVENESCITNSELSSSTDSSMLRIVQSYEQSRLKFLGKDRRLAIQYKDSMERHWLSMVRNKEPMLDMLRKYKGKDSNDLYGCEVRDYPNSYGRMSDQLHALFLIESLQASTRDFNRDRVFPHSYTAAFRNEKLNFIYDGKNAPGLSSLRPWRDVPDSLAYTDMSLLWELCDQSIQDGTRFSEKLKVHNLFWYCHSASQ